MLLSVRRVCVSAALVPLSIGADPFVTHMIENSSFEIPASLIEVFPSYGSHAFSDSKNFITGALPSMINGASIALLCL